MTQHADSVQVAPLRRQRGACPAKLAVKSAISVQIDAVMQAQGITKAALARRMGTTRAQVDRLLDPDNPAITLSTLLRAAEALECDLSISLERQ
ncbi:DNA-binding Xre family transcriptional regulator [Paraburkholderia sp. BL8N3]|nr:DNA-binding Xre family transcriptional regulator [Paraburkholderia sp. BL8N3]